jgi:flagellar biosynthesis protein FlhG
MVHGRRTRVVSISSGKGGVGKTTLVANLAFKFSQMGKKVLLFDGDMGMANIEIFFGARPQGSIYDVLQGDKTIHEVMVEVSPHIHLIPGGSGIFDLQNLDNFRRRTLVESISTLPQDFDIMLIDTSPGLGENVLYFNSAAETKVIILTPDPSSLADSYALIKVLNKKYKQTNFSLLCNQVKDEVEGLRLYQKFSDVTNKFLSIGLDYLGSVPQDSVLRANNQMQRLVVKHEPQSSSAQAISQLAPRLARSASKSSSQSETHGGLEKFWAQVIGVA